MLRLASRAALLAALAALALLAGCPRQVEGPDVGARPDVGGMDAGADAPTRSCTTDTECDDGLACTNDRCGVGNACRNTPLDELCMPGQRCVPGAGCTIGMTATCTSAADCDDGRFCTGVETCIGPAGNMYCLPGTPVDCDDGNACTIETCDEAARGCAYEPAPGCDAGVPVGVDAAAPCPDFEIARDVTGTFGVRPPQISSCFASATYSIREATFRRTAERLEVQLDRFTLTGPLPTGPEFRVTFMDGCASFVLDGRFTCADQWTASWTATFSGATCALCPGQSATVGGTRR
ncbi:MAG: hypothetical protein OHK0013_27320 [Sandaracinaceae bacterium]